jgi:hypothetical protein
MTAQRAANKAETQADLSGLADDIKVATDLAGSAMSERKDREKAIEEARTIKIEVARLQSSILSISYCAIMQDDARHFEDACKIDKEILKRLGDTLMTAQAFRPSLAVTPFNAGEFGGMSDNAANGEPGSGWVKTVQAKIKAKLDSGGSPVRKVIHKGKVLAEGKPVSDDGVADADMFVIMVNHGFGH